MTTYALPASLCFSSVSLSLRRTVGRTVSPFTLEEQSFLWPGEQWGASVQVPPMDEDTAMEIIAFFNRLRGSFDNFYLGNPARSTPRGVATGTPLVNGSLQTGNTLITDGWSNNITGILKAGDFIQINSGTGAELNQVALDVNSDGSGNATIPLVKTIRTSPANNSAVVVSNPVGVFRLTNDSFTYSVEPGRIYRMSFEAVEVVNA
jgi:hypothetical protein